MLVFIMLLFIFLRINMLFLLVYENLLWVSLSFFSEYNIFFDIIFLNLRILIVLLFVKMVFGFVIGIYEFGFIFFVVVIIVSILFFVFIL